MTSEVTKFKASYHQERLWFIDKFETANLYQAQPTYHNIPLLLRFKGPLNRSTLARSINLVAGKHEALRTTIHTENETPVQWIGEGASIRLCVEERPHRQFNHENPEQFEEILETGIEPMPMNGESLLRARLFAFLDDTSVLLLVFHHAVVDRRSVDIIASEILATYEALQSEAEVEGSKPELQYADFSEWQRALTPEDWDPSLFYWKRQLAGPLDILDLPTDRPRAPIHVYSPRQVVFPISKSLFEMAEQFGRSLGIRVQDVLLGSWILLLHRYSSRSEINVGVMMPNRRNVDTRQVIGPVANLVTIRSLVDATRSKVEFIADLKRLVAEAEAYQELPFEMLVMELAPVPDMSRTALFDVLFQFEPLMALPRISGATVEKIENNFGLGKYDLNLLIKEQDGEGTGYLVYNSLLYQKSTIRRLVRHYTKLLASLVNDLRGPISELDPLDPEEKMLLRDGWNDTGAKYPDTETLTSLFEHTVKAWPDRVALVQRGLGVSYRELNTRSNRLARFLRQSGRIKRGSIVGICLEKSPQMIVAVLAVLKAGATYVPIDPALPPSRRDLIISDTGCAIVFGTPLSDQPASSMFIVPEALDLRAFSCENPGHGPLPDDPAYVIYTSGSTGTPKGCRVSHRNVVRLMTNDRHDFDFHERDVWILAHSLNFDFSVWEIWGALLYGAKLVLPEKVSDRDVAELLRVIKENRVTVLNQTPDSFYVLSAAAVQNSEHDLAAHLRMVVFGGAKLDPTRFKAWVQRYPLDRIRLINMYGITETTVHVTYYEITATDIQSEFPVSVIGRPLPETRVFIGDSQGQPSPIGVWGEIHVGGTGVAEGYLNRPELTAARFVEKSSLGSGRLYASGDIGRWLDNGTIEFLGRRDNQVKIRGFRIEKDEIAFFLNQHPDIRDAIVMARVSEHSQTDELVAYYTEPVREEGKSGLTPAALREFLSGHLPGYMIPALFVAVPRIPLNSSGKVDFRLLTSTNSGSSKLSGLEHVLPRDRAERVIVEVWERCLRHQNIGIHDNYFDLGGHSLTATRIVAEINAGLPGNMKLSDVFQFPTVAQLAAHLSGRPYEATDQPFPVSGRDFYPASPGQQGIWAHEQLDEEKHIYNIPAAFRLTGDLDFTALSKAIDELVARHESLRTSFIRQEEALYQIVSPLQPFQIQREDFSTDEHREELTRELINKAAVMPFDLARGPLFRVTLVKLGPREHVLVVTLHHIISDGWSLSVLQRELAALFTAHQRGIQLDLPRLPYQYKDFSCWLQARLESDETAKLRCYWREKLALPWPVDPLARIAAGDEAAAAFEGQTLVFRMNPDRADTIRNLAREERHSLFTVLVAFVKILLYKCTGEPDVIVGSPVSGRQVPGLEGQIGCFLNMLPLRDKIPRDASFRELLAQVRETFLDAIDHQEFPLERMVDEAGRGDWPGLTPLFSVVVILQDPEQVTLEFEGIEVTPIPVEKATSLFDLVFEFREAGSFLELGLSFRRSRFAANRIERLWAHFETVVAQCLDQPEAPLRRLCILPPEEVKLLHSLSAPSPGNQGWEATNIVEAFGSVSREHADQHALAMDGQTVSYARLRLHADTLARELTGRYQIRTDDIVALLFEPSIEMIAALLGVLKAGAAYLPLDPRWPKKRIEYVLSDSGCRLVLCGPDLDRMAQESCSIPVLAVGRELSSKGWGGTLPTISPGQLAYVIYTSGSSGQPKGVMIEHHSVMNLIRGLDNRIYSQYPPGLNVGCTASLVFDASVQQIFAALLSGHTLFLVPESVKKSPQDFIAFVRDHSIHVLDLTPSLFQMLLRVHPPGDFAPALKHLIIGGEVLPASSVNAFYSSGRNRGVVISNVYGPTEATVDATCYDCLLEAKQHPVPIGRPLPNVRILVLDENLGLTPFGDCGEICIGGVGLARGYTNPGTSSSTKFVAGLEVGEDRLYQTGDFARWNQEGDLQFLGRIDRQVKLRGHRIELAEIEAKLLACEGVVAAVVTLVGEGENRNICAYYVGDNQINEALVTTHLREQLPAPMIPSFVVRIPEFPLNSSGKVDLTALPRPVPSGLDSTIPGHHTASASLVSIWSKVLKIDPACIDGRKTFFELGGNSLSSVYLLAEIYERLGVSIRLADFFGHPDILSLATFIETQRARGDSRISAGPPGEAAILPLTFQQMRIWIQCEKAPTGAPYHLPGSLVFDRPYDETNALAALRALVANHQCLRLRIELRDGEVMQLIETDPPIPFECLDISLEMNLAEARQRIISEVLLRPFDHQRGPWFRFISLGLSPQRHEILYNFHHLITDGWSVEILKREFTKIYDGLATNTPYTPDLGRHTHFDYVRLHLAESNLLENLEKATQFWSRRIGQGLPRPQIGWPGGTTSGVGLGFGCQIADEVTDVLRSRAKTLHATVPMILFTVFLRLLQRFYPSDQVAGYLIHAGRDRAEFKDTVGMFVDPLVVITRLNEFQTMGQMVIDIQREVHEILQHRAVPMEAILDKLGMPPFAPPYAFNMLDIPGFVHRPEPGHHGRYFLSDLPAPKFQIELYVVDQGENIEVFWNLDGRHFDRSMAEYLHDEYAKGLQNFASDPAFPLVSGDEHRTISLPGGA